MPERRPVRDVAAVVAAIIASLEGLLLIANGTAVAWLAVRDGVTGPDAVASPAGIAVEVVLYLLFGAGLLVVARGLLAGSRAALTPFVLAQVLALTVAVPLAQGGGAPSVIGGAVVASCVAGIVCWAILVKRQYAEDR